MESQIPTPKTVGVSRMGQYIEYILAHIQNLFRFYNFKSAPFRFYDCQGRQRANNEMANILLNGGRKHNEAKRKKTNRNRRRKRRRRRRLLQNQTDSHTVTTDYVHTKSTCLLKAKIYTFWKSSYCCFRRWTEEQGERLYEEAGTSGVVLNTLHKRSKQYTAGIVSINENNTSKVHKAWITSFEDQTSSHRLSRFVPRVKRRGWNTGSLQMGRDSLGY